MCLIKNSSVLLSLLIVGVDCVMDIKVLNLVTPIRQPIHGPHPLIGRSLTSVNWIFISSLPFWMNPEEIFFPISVGRRCGCAAVRERLLLVNSIFFGLIFTIRGFI